MKWKGNDGQVSNSSTHAASMQRCLFLALRRLGRNLLPISSPGLPKMADDRTGGVCDVCSSVMCQSIPIDERFLCGYRLIID